MPTSPSSLSLPKLPVVAALGLSTASAAVAQGAADPLAPEGGSTPSPAPVVEGSPGPGSAAPPASMELTGTWTAMASDALGDGLVEPVPRARPAVTFLDDARLEGTTTCGGYIGSWSADGERLRIGILTAGTSPCDQAGSDEEFVERPA